MKHIFGLFTAIAASLRGDLTVSGRVLAIDNFESYTTTSIGSGAATTPWLRFGGVSDHLTAHYDQSLDGSQSAKIPIAVPARSPRPSVTITLHRHEPEPVQEATVLTKSLAASPNTHFSCRLRTRRRVSRRMRCS